MTTRQLCPSCCRFATLTLANVCADCTLADHLNFLFPIPSREYILANTNDGTEYVPPVMQAEFSR